MFPIKPLRSHLVIC